MNESHRNKVYRTNNKDKLALKYKQYCKTIRGKFNKILKDIRKRAGTVITIEDLETLWVKQNGKCALTGLQMTYDHTGSSLDAVTIDRIDPAGLYNLINIRLVSKWANMARSSLADDDFVSWCRLVVNGATDGYTREES